MIRRSSVFEAATLSFRRVAEAAASRCLDDDGLAGIKGHLRAGAQAFHTSINATNEVRAGFARLAALRPERPHAAEA